MLTALAPPVSVPFPSRPERGRVLALEFPVDPAPRGQTLIIEVWAGDDQGMPLRVGTDQPLSLRVFLERG